MTGKAKRALIIIGGHEDKQNEKIILSEIARRLGDGKLVICTAATQEPEEMFRDYERVFRALGVKHIHHLNFTSRAEAREEKQCRKLAGAAAVFFTGGDQLELTSQMGDTPCFDLTQRVYEEGGLIAGTSAGAAVMCETMMVSGASEQSHRLSDTIKMASGFGFIQGVVIDQHFAERGRIGRLLGVIAQNPKNIGLGIDENTAVVVEDRAFYVLGAGAVYVVDCRDVSDSNIADEHTDQTLAVYHVRLHLLTQGHAFDLQAREPRPLTEEQQKRRFPPLPAITKGE